MVQQFDKHIQLFFFLMLPNALIWIQSFAYYLNIGLGMNLLYITGDRPIIVLMSLAGILSFRLSNLRVMQ